MKTRIQIRLSDEALATLDASATLRGLTRTGVIEMLLRLYADAQREHWHQEIQAIVQHGSLPTPAPESAQERTQTHARSSPDL